MDPADFSALQRHQDADRARARHGMAEQTDTDIRALYEDAWAARHEVTRVIIATTEELLARHIKAVFPEAASVVLYEDVSHDAPHGHVHSVRDAAGDVIIEGTSDAWHDAEWSGDIDEFVWDLFHLDRDGFLADAHGLRVRTIAL